MEKSIEEKERKGVFKSRKFKLLIVGLVLSLLTIGIAYATAYVTLQLYVNSIVVDNPKVCFVKWSDLSKANTFSYAVSIFPNVKTVDENITYGIWNWDSEAHNIYFRLASENTNTTDVSWIFYKVYNGGTLFSKNETNLNSPDTNWSTSCSAVAYTKYAIWLEIRCASDAGVGHTPTFTFEMKVENP